MRNITRELPEDVEVTTTEYKKKSFFAIEYLVLNLQEVLILDESLLQYLGDD